MTHPFAIWPPRILDLAIVMLLLAIAMFVLLRPSSSGPVTGRAVVLIDPPGRGLPRIQVLTLAARRVVSNAELSGEFRNVSTSDLEGVAVCADFRDAGGKTLARGRTVLPFVLEPSRNRRFYVSVADDERIGRIEVTFRRLSGEPLPVRSDSRSGGRAR